MSLRLGGGWCSVRLQRGYAGLPGGKDGGLKSKNLRQGFKPKAIQIRLNIVAVLGCQFSLL